MNIIVSCNPWFFVVVIVRVTNKYTVTQNISLQILILKSTIHYLTLISLGGQKPPAIFYFSFTDPDFMKFGDFSQKLPGINILLFCSQFELAFGMSALFHNQVLLFMYVFCWNNEYILENISCVWALNPEGLEKHYLDASIINLSEKYSTSMTVLKCDDVIKKVKWPWLLFWYFLKDLV